MNGPFRILSIDGGGLRGIIPIQVIKYIEEYTQTPIHKLFDLIAGTSTGGLLTCALTYPDHKSAIGNTRKYSLEQIEKIYTERGAEIFPLIKNYHEKSIRGIRNYFRPQFDPRNLEKILYEYFNDDCITSCLTPVLISSFNYHRNVPIFFTTREARLDPDTNPKLVDVCRATSAAPTYFPPYSFGYNTENITCIDGGIVVNNPTMAAFMEIMGNPEYMLYRKHELQKLELNDIQILSLGTGRIRYPSHPGKASNWGKLAWVKPIIDIATGGPVKIIDHQVRTLFSANDLHRNYLRIDVDIDKKYAEMSDASTETIAYLKETSQTLLSNNHTLTEQIKLFFNSNVNN